MGTSFCMTAPTLTGSGGRTAGFGASLHPDAETTTAAIRNARAHMLTGRMLAGVYCMPWEQRSVKSSAVDSPRARVLFGRASGLSDDAAAHTEAVGRLQVRHDRVSAQAGA